MPNAAAATGAFPEPGHDHANCIDDALTVAGRLCEDRGARLTELRRRVLELVWNSHKPVGAYEILEQLAAQDGRRAAPPTVYRALDFLLDQGLVHRVESANAFIGCSRPEEAHVVQFLLCRACGRAAEVAGAEVGQAVRRSAARHGFAIDRQTIEVTGTCAGCRRAAHG